jgi:hypothetical protein
MKDNNVEPLISLNKDLWTDISGEIEQFDADNDYAIQVTTATDKSKKIANVYSGAKEKSKLVGSVEMDTIYTAKIMKVNKDIYCSVVIGYKSNKLTIAVGAANEKKEWVFSTPDTQKSNFPDVLTDAVIHVSPKS